MMAYVDYIHCVECDCKLIYDGDYNARDTLDSRHPDGWSLMCPECLADLRAALAAATDRIKMLEGELQCEKIFRDAAVNERNAETHRADALAARLAEVEDREHPA